MADDTTTPPTKAAKAKHKPAAKRATGAAKGASAKRASAPKAAGINARAARAQPSKSTADTIRDTLNERIVKPARAAAESATENARSAAQSARDGVSNAASQGSTFGLKMIEHAEHNAREAFDAMRAAARSKDVSDVLKVQGEYLREQGARSLSQAREVADMIAQFGRDAIAPLTGRKK